MKYLAAILALALSGCASQTFYRTGETPIYGKDKEVVGTKSVAVKAFQNYGDLVGNVHFNTYSGEFSVEQPTAPAPIQKQLVLNKNGEVIGINETPMLAGVYNSKVNESMWGNLLDPRKWSNLVGTVLSGMMGIAAVQGATQSSIAASNAAVAQSGQAAKVSLGQEAAKVKLAEIAAKPIP